MEKPDMAFMKCCTLQQLSCYERVRRPSFPRFACHERFLSQTAASVVIAAERSLPITRPAILPISGLMREVAIVEEAVPRTLKIGAVAHWR
jgi:hypothetical protein